MSHDCVTCGQDAEGQYAYTGGRRICERCARETGWLFARLLGLEDATTEGEGILVTWEDALRLLGSLERDITMRVCTREIHLTDRDRREIGLAAKGIDPR